MEVNMKYKLNFKAAPGAQFSNEDAQKYGPEIYALSEKYEECTPELAVRTASPPKSRLHDYFLWDNKKCGHLYRLEQARHLINHLIIVVEYPSGEEKETKAFFNLKTKKGTRSYIPVEVVANDEFYYQQVLQEAMNEIIEWKRRYSDYRELRLIFGAVEETQKKLFGAEKVKKKAAKMQPAKKGYRQKKPESSVMQISI